MPLGGRGKLERVMTFPLVPTVIIISLCGGIFAASLAFVLTRNIKAVVVSGLVVFASGGLLYLQGLLQQVN